jgi:hypothetical protein
MPLVVCDAGPLIHLDELGCMDLLLDFSEVLWCQRRYGGKCGSIGPVLSPILP